MRTIFFMRGAPGSGKSTWISKNGLDAYALEADKIRTIMQSPLLLSDGTRTITQNNDTEVWDFLFKCLENRMRRGEFIVVDGTHYKRKLLSNYKKLIHAYRYRAYVVDFTDIPEKLAQAQNLSRPVNKQVPAAAISKMYAVFNNDPDKKEVPGFMNNVTREEAEKILRDPMLFKGDFEKYVIFGDIHGCMDPLRKYFAAHPFDEEKTEYIFVGDYVDRGIENDKVIEFLLSMKNHRNVILLEGNHEKWLRLWSREHQVISIPREDKKVLEKYVDKSFFREYYKDAIHSKEFENNTEKQLEAAGITKKDVRMLCDRLVQMTYFEAFGKKYFVTHGGVPLPPSVLTPAFQYIMGTGSYEDIKKTYDTWMEKAPADTVMVHGHRNFFNYPAKYNDRIYNLCSAVEDGAPLRILEITKAGEKVLEIPNDVYNKNRIQEAKEKEEADKAKTASPVTESPILQQLNESRLVRKNILDDDIVSYNFTRDAFDNRKWNAITEKARGLFVNSKTEKVVARGYDKFFNWGEMKGLTDTLSLKNNLKFPVTAYRKENGFLGLISWNPETDSIFIASKTSNKTYFADLVRKSYITLLREEDREKIETFLKDGRHTMVFECVNPEEDPHIIPYAKPHLYLLDIIDNTFETHRMPFKDMVLLADEFHLEHKSFFHTFKTFEELYDFIEKEKAEDTTKYEGWVFEDQNGFMVKFKTSFYKFWKHMRLIKSSIENHRPLKEYYINKEEIEVTKMMQSMEDSEPGTLKPLNMFDIEEAYTGKRVYADE